MDKVRIGVIGTGFGKRHIRAFHEHSRAVVTAVCSASAERAAAVAAEFGVTLAYGDWQQLLTEAPVDAVVVATPPNLHLPMCAAAFEVGKHVLCEKPLAGTFDDARALLDRARGSRLVHGIDIWTRVRPGCLYAKELLDDGAIGRPISFVDAATHNVPAYYAWSGGSPNKEKWFTSREHAGGFVLAVTPYTYDRLIWMFGPAESANGQLDTLMPRVALPDGRIIHSDAPDSARAHLTFRGGLHGTTHLAPAVWSGPRSRLEIHGDAGSLLVEGAMDISVKLARAGDADYRELPIPERLISQAPEGVPPFYPLVDRFLRAILDGEPMSPTIEDGFRAQELLEAIARSNESGQWQQLPLTTSEDRK